LFGKVKIDKRTGELASAETPVEFVSYQSVYNHHSILFYIDKNDPLGPAPVSPQNDPQFNLWEEPVLKWAQKNKQIVPTSTEVFPDWIDATNISSSTEVVASSTINN